MIAVDWTGSWSILLYAAGTIVTLGTAALLLTNVGSGLLRRLRPPTPLISFGHPSESGMPWVYFAGTSDADWERQTRAAEEARLQGLNVTYLIENKGTTNADAVRELSTGIRGRDGEAEHRFDAVFAQILGPGEKLDVTTEKVPEKMHRGMTDTDRALNFVYWARFQDSGRRRWEATYDPQTRDLDYEKL